MQGVAEWCWHAARAGDDGGCELRRTSVEGNSDTQTDGTRRPAGVKHTGICGMLTLSPSLHRLAEREDTDVVQQGGSHHGVLNHWPWTADDVALNNGRGA